MEVLAGVFIYVSIGQCLETFQQFRTGGFICRFTFGNFHHHRLLDFLNLEEGIVVTLDEACFHQVLAVIPQCDDFVYALCRILDLVVGNNLFKFFQGRRKGCNLCCLFCCCLFGGNLFGVGFVTELIETCVDFVQGCLLVAHAQSACFCHESVELSLDGQGILLGCQVVCLAEKCILLTCKEGCCLLATVFSFLLGANLVRDKLAYGSVLGILGDVCHQCVRVYLLGGDGCNFFVCITSCHTGQNACLLAGVDQFLANSFAGGVALQQVVCKMSFLQVVQQGKVFARCFFNILKLLECFVLVAVLSQGLDAFVAIVYGNSFQHLEACYFLYCCGTNFYIRIGIGQRLNNALIVDFLFYGGSAYSGVRLFPIRLHKIKKAHKKSPMGR